MKLREIRLQNGISQAKLAKTLGVARTTITNYESGESKPDIEMIMNIAKYFNVSTDYLLDFNQEQEKKEPEKVEFKTDRFTKKQKEILRYVERLDDYQCKVAKIYFETLLDDFKDVEQNEEKKKENN